MLKTVTKRNLKILRNWTADDFCTWLLESLGGKSYGEIYIATEPSIERQVIYLFDAADSTIQERVIKVGLVKAINEWRSSSQDYHVLENLVYIAAQIRATGATPRLRQLLKTRHFEDHVSGPAGDARDSIVGALCGFPTVAGVEDTLLELFKSAEHAEYGGQLFLALCRASPERYPEFAGQLMTLVRRKECSIRLRQVLLRFLKNMDQVTLQRRFNDLATYSAEEFAYRLCELNVEDRGLRIVPRPVPPRGETEAELHMMWEVTMVGDADPSAGDAGGLLLPEPLLREGLNKEICLFAARSLERQGIARTVAHFRQRVRSIETREMKLQTAAEK